MAKSGKGFFDGRGQYFRTPEEATCSDFAAMLGKIGDGDSLAPGIANILLERREEIERIYAEHDAMFQESLNGIDIPAADNVAPLRGKK